MTAAERGKRDEQRAAATIEIDDDAPADENTPPDLSAKGKGPATVPGAAVRVKSEGPKA